MKQETTLERMTWSKPLAPEKSAKYRARLTVLDRDITRLDKILTFRRKLYPPSDPTTRALSARRDVQDRRRHRVRLALKRIIL